MSLFNFGKKKPAPSCPESIQILGSGCKTCHQQYENAKKAVHNLGLTVSVDYITDMQKVMEYGVMVMPAIVIDGKVAVSDKLLSAKDVEKLLRGEYR